jgi:hypothetical protein
VPDFGPDVGEPSEVRKLFTTKLLPTAVQSHGLKSVFYTYYAVTYYVRSVAFPDTKKCFLLPCIKDTAEGAMSVTAL